MNAIWTRLWLGLKAAFRCEPGVSGAFECLVRTGPAVGACIIAGTALHYLYTVRPTMRQLVVQALVQASTNTSSVRGVLVDVPMLQRKEPANHTHPAVAALRNQATDHLVHCAAQLGYRPFVLQMSNSNARQGLSGQHTWYWAKDTVVPQSDEEPRPGDAIILVMTDFHADMNSLMTEYPECAFFIYTISPNTAGKREKEYAYCFNEDQTISWHVSGGAEFRHRLYTYGKDSVGTALGNWGCTPASFIVERRDLGLDTQLIFLLPLCRLRNWIGYTPAAFKRWCWSWLDVPVLERFEPVHQGFVRFKVNTPDGLMVTTAPAGSYSSTTVPADVDSQIAAYARASKSMVTNTGVLSFVPDGDRRETIHVTSYHMLCKSREDPTWVVSAKPPVQPVVRYQTGHRPDEVAKPAMTVLCPPIVAGVALSPDKCTGNTVSAIIERQIKPANDTLPSNYMRKCMAEFVHLIEVKSGVPRGSVDMQTLEELMTTQNRPSQRKMLEEASTLGRFDTDRPATAFPKTETYQELKAPRVIVSFGAHDKLDLALFLNALSVVLKKCDWYLFVDPATQSSRIVGRCGGNVDLYETDFSKMDAHVSAALRELEMMFSLHFLCPDLADMFLDTFRADYDKIVYIGDIAFRTRWQRLSGSAGTSLFNTLAAAFFQYYAARLGDKAGHGLTPEEAWDSMGVVGGDDGLLRASIPAERYLRAANALGQEVKMVRVPAGQPANLLGRFYGELRDWKANSCADIKRALAKFHLTVGQCDAVTRVAEKATAYALTDANTPVLGPLCLALVARYGKTDVTPEFGFLARRTAEFGTQVPNEHAAWMDELVERDLPGFNHATLDVIIASPDTLFWPERTPCWQPPTVVEPQPLDDVVHHPLTTAAHASALVKNPANELGVDTRVTPDADTVIKQEPLAKRKPGRRKRRPLAPGK